MIHCSKCGWPIMPVGCPCSILPDWDEKKKPLEKNTKKDRDFLEEEQAKRWPTSP